MSEFSCGIKPNGFLLSVNPIASNFTENKTFFKIGDAAKCVKTVYQCINLYDKMTCSLCTYM